MIRVRVGAAKDHLPCIALLYSRHRKSQDKSRDSDTPPRQFWIIPSWAHSNPYKNNNLNFKKSSLSSLRTALISIKSGSVYSFLFLTIITVMSIEVMLKMYFKSYKTNTIHTRC